MKQFSFLVVAMSLLLSWASEPAQPAPPPAVGFYFVDPSEAEHLIATESDVVSYNWHTHSFVLRAEAIARLPSRASVPIGGIPFVWRVAGEICYRGAFWSPVSPIATKQPIIDLSKVRKSELHIDRGYPPGTPHFGQDPRANEQLRAVLQRLHKLN